MKTDTRQKMFKFIEEKGQVAPKEIVDFIGFSAPAVFRQLKKLIDEGKIQKTGSPPHVLYHLPMSPKELAVQPAISWTSSLTPPELEPDDHCQTRDVFQARHGKLPKDLGSVIKEEQLVFLLSAVIGEIGNNSFDHNLGNWPDMPGVFFRIDFKKRVILLADRGQGVLTSLQKVRPNIPNHREAIKIAFTEILSGRMPEHRGNGLKFVRRVIEENKLLLRFYSGSAKCIIQNGKTKFLDSDKNIKGTVAVIEF